MSITRGRGGGLLMGGPTQFTGAGRSAVSGSESDSRSSKDSDSDGAVAYHNCSINFAEGPAQRPRTDQTGYAHARVPGHCWPPPPAVPH
jgi:hypothetical protein